MIREHPRFQTTAIIFVSAVMMTHPDQLRGYQLGGVDYVPVPVVPELLRAKVKVFVDLYRKTRQLERFNAELEQRVAERTADLQRFNEELELRIEERTRERETALAQLFEAQKMDTIGQLTGGVAHDFNNLLMAVLGSLSLLEKRLPRRSAQPSAAAERRAGSPARRGADAASAGLFAPAGTQAGARRCAAAGERDGRAAEARRRARHRADGRNSETTLPPVLVDANQLELALLNVALNARDAMPTGGMLTIAATPRDANRRRRLDANLPPGDYVRIAITDNGVGMDEATLAKATEPFFTTKGPGKGTGLGLSMVHGLAAQSGGLSAHQQRAERRHDARVVAAEGEQPRRRNGAQRGSVASARRRTSARAAY